MKNACNLIIALIFTAVKLHCSLGQLKELTRRGWGPQRYVVH